MKSENNQEHQPAIYNSDLAKNHRLSQSSWSQLSAIDRNTWNYFDISDKAVILSKPSFVNTSNNNNIQGYQPRDNTRNQYYGERIDRNKIFSITSKYHNST